MMNDSKREIKNNCYIIFLYVLYYGRRILGVNKKMLTSFFLFIIISLLLRNGGIIWQLN